MNKNLAEKLLYALSIIYPLTLYSTHYNSIVFIVGFISVAIPIILNIVLKMKKTYDLFT